MTAPNQAPQFEDDMVRAAHNMLRDLAEGSLSADAYTNRPADSPVGVTSANPVHGPLTELDTVKAELADVTRSHLGLAEIDAARSQEVDAMDQQLRLQEIAVGKAISESGRDTLTGLKNRTGMYEAFERLAKQRLRRREDDAATDTPAGCFVMLDVDHFKQLNDSQGHIAGDRALQELATLLGAALRETDTLVRWGGEEFAILLENVDAPTAKGVIDSLRREIFEGTKSHITFSAGVATVNPSDLNETNKRADAALYEAKEKGRDQVVISTAA